MCEKSRIRFAKFKPSLSGTFADVETRSRVADLYRNNHNTLEATNFRTTPNLTSLGGVGNPVLDTAATQGTFPAEYGQGDERCEPHPRAPW